MNFAEKIEVIGGEGPLLEELAKRGIAPVSPEDVKQIKVPVNCFMRTLNIARPGFEPGDELVAIGTGVFRFSEADEVADHLAEHELELEAMEREFQGAVADGEADEDADRGEREWD